MGNAIAGVVAGTVILLTALCLILVPWFLWSSYLLKRDCELINQVECHWQMLPEPSSQN